MNHFSSRIEESRRVMLEIEELGVSIPHDLHQQHQSLMHTNNTEEMIEKKDCDKVTKVICKLREVNPYFNDINVEALLRATGDELDKE